MANLAIARQQEREGDPLSRWLGFAPLSRGGLFGVNPFALMRQFTEDMDRSFTGTSSAGVWRPTLEVKQKEGNLVITAELPGLRKEDVTVNVTDNTLTLEGERKQEKEEKREGFYHSERSYGKFVRSIPLPEGAKVDQTAAQFKDGVLEITIPVPEPKAKSQKIQIK